MKQTSFPSTIHQGTRAVLNLDGVDVGAIEVQGQDDSWTFGRFTPADTFAPFATIYGRWSLIMHEDVQDPLSPEAAEVLRETERKMDELHVRIYFPETDQWHAVRQLNLDGELVEWKEV